jgi:hypothetical protein
MIVREVKEPSHHHLTSSETAVRSTSVGVAFHLATPTTDRGRGHGTELCSSVSQYLHNTDLWIMQSPPDPIGSSYIDTELSRLLSIGQGEL